LEADFADRDIGIRLQGLQGLRSAIGNERFGQLATEFGYAGLGSTVDHNTMQYLASLKRLDAANAASGEKAPAKSQNWMTEMLGENWSPGKGAEKMAENPYEHFIANGGDPYLVPYLRKKLEEKGLPPIVSDPAGE